MPKEAIGGTLTGQGGVPLPFSKAIRAGDFVYVSGQVAFGADGLLVEGGIEAQTRQTLSNVQAVLEEAGCKMSDVIKCTCWLDDARDFGAFNKTYASFFTTEPPARSTVRSDLMIDAKVEIEAIAYKPV